MLLIKVGDVFWKIIGQKKIVKTYINKYTKLGFSKDLALRVYTTRLLGRN